MTHSDKKIAYILSLKGGIPSFNYREIEAVSSAGYEVHVFPTKMTKGMYMPKPEWPLHVPSYSKAAVSMVYWLVKRPGAFLKAFSEALSDRALPELGLASQFAREMGKMKTSLIHCHFADRKMFTAYLCSALSRIPFTVTVHSHELVFYANRKLFLKGLNASARILTVCDYNRDFLVSKMHIPHEKVETVRLVVPLEELKPDNRMKVLTVGKFFEYKGHDVLIAAARLLKEDPIVFWVVGEGPVDVKEMASELIEEGKVKLLGSVNEDNLRILYQMCDVFCLPSKTAKDGQKEGLPVAIMEAMAYSKPVVSTLHAGIPELVDRVIVPENDPQALANALRAYIHDPALRRSDGDNNRTRVERMHGPDQLRKLLSAFESTK